MKLALFVRYFYSRMALVYWISFCHSVTNPTINDLLKNMVLKNPNFDDPIRKHKSVIAFVSFWALWNIIFGVGSCYFNIQHEFKNIFNLIQSSLGVNHKLKMWNLLVYIFMGCMHMA